MKHAIYAMKFEGLMELVKYLRGSEVHLNDISPPIVTEPQINDEEEPGIVDLPTAIRGTCEKSRFMDIIEILMGYFDITQRLRTG